MRKETLPGKRRLKVAEKSMLDPCYTAGAAAIVSLVNLDKSLQAGGNIAGALNESMSYLPHLPCTHYPKWRYDDICDFRGVCLLSPRHLIELKFSRIHLAQLEYFEFEPISKSNAEFVLGVNFSPTAIKRFKMSTVVSQDLL
ncbi:hypothetical protein SAY86_018297 [Trapa natans]|uniref:Uncharacterized protein n=1 Tax=Trapa natans TaxID=22666 RepID=A0AAN7LGM6_TRANT|nr:hypothetical protein SAY86_018297 [Trapa natans]